MSLHNSQFTNLLRFLSILTLAKNGKDYSLISGTTIYKWAAEGLAFLGTIDYETLKSTKLEYTHKVAILQIAQGLAKNEDYVNYYNSVHLLAFWIDHNTKSKLWTKLDTFSTSQGEFLDNLRKILYIDSQAAEIWLHKSVGKLGYPNLTKCFKIDYAPIAIPDNFSDYFTNKSDAEILEIITEIAADLDNSIDYAPDLKITHDVAGLKDPEKFEVWKQGKSYLSKKASDALRYIVRTHGIATITDVVVLPVQEAIESLFASNIVWPILNRKLIKGEYTSESGCIYTSTGLSLGRTIPASSVLIYNLKYVEDYTNKFNADSKGGMKYLDVKAPKDAGYTPVSPVGRANANKAKSFIKVADFNENLEDHRKAWTEKLYSTNDIEHMVATIIEIAYQTAMRISSKEGSALINGIATRTFGLTTLHVKNVDQHASYVKLSYLGKDAQNQIHRLKRGIDDACDMAIQNLEEFTHVGNDYTAEFKQPDEYIFVIKGNRINSATVNKFLKKFTKNKDISIHKFRHIKASVLAAPILEHCPLYGTNCTYKIASDWLAENLKIVGEELGHFHNAQTTAKTAIESYLDPLVVKEFYNKCGAKLPANIAALLEKEENE